MGEIRSFNGINVNVAASAKSCLLSGSLCVAHTVMRYVNIVPFLQGGVSDEVTLSAYITAGFLEMNSSTDVSKLPPQNYLTLFHSKLRNYKINIYVHQSSLH